MGSGDGSYNVTISRSECDCTGGSSIKGAHSQQKEPRETQSSPDIFFAYSLKRGAHFKIETLILK